jgi:1,4-alpha-glucan branching enzyme
MLSFERASRMTEKEQKNTQVLIRTTDTEKAKWKDAADAEGKGLSEWIRELANYRSEQILVCDHPKSQRQVYPWSEICTKCGTRLRDGQEWLVEPKFR